MVLSVEFEKVGPINRGSVSLHNLMLFCGENNAGKTYASYVLYNVFDKKFQTAIDYLDEKALKSSGIAKVDLEDALDRYEEVTEAWSDELTRSLPELFNAEPSGFANSAIALRQNVEHIKNEIFDAPFENRWSFNGRPAGRVTKPAKSFMAEVRLEEGTEDLDDFDFSYVLNAGIIRFFDTLIFKDLYSDAFLLPAERAGLNLFYKELNASRNELLRKVTSEVRHDSLVFDLKKEISMYAKPISDYLTFLNRLSFYARQKSSFSDLALKIQETVLKGSYVLDDTGIQYVSDSAEAANDNFKIGLHTSSSTAKTLFGLVFYFNHMAVPGATLIIDEPELNLHPDNQRKLARILAEATNRGLRVILSTHSDYIVKEFNNLIMLSNDFENKEHIMQKFGYTVEQILEPQNVGAYMFADHTIAEMEVNEREGIIAETFNEVINQYNDSNDEIYYALMENEEHAESD
ncbi:AAA family ATPase [Saccharibacillus sp. WB 17]|nr:AAA family ATPase [Saccharibacillus sp. WB 17]MWJ32865.1 AAA family ATPase [Saccharibacillus sp. WB 17]